MVDESLRSEIQSAYSEFLQSKSLKPRYGQKLMIAEIARALSAIEEDDNGHRTNDAGIAVVEAGTGTGKTVAYILSALPFAKKHGKTLIVSTATITLQGQIVEKDLPDIYKNASFDFKYALAKGRGRYLCLNKLTNVRDMQSGVLASMPLFEDSLTDDQKAQNFFDHLDESYQSGEWDGDKDQLVDEVEDRLWSYVTATHRECSNRRCHNFKECAYFKARRELDEVDIIIANHDLVLADLSLGGGAVLPGPNEAIYVFDEAHHLADKALSHFSASADLKGSLHFVDQWRKTQKKLEKELMHAASLRPVYLKNEQTMIEAEARIRDLWVLCQQVANFPAHNGSQYDAPIFRFVDGVLPQAIQELAGVLKINFSTLLAGFSRLEQAMKSALAEDNDEITKAEGERWFSIVGTYHLRCEGLLSLFKSYSMSDEGRSIPHARWIEQRTHNGEEELRLQASPILASATLNTVLWQEAYGAVLTSATLTASNKFERLKMQSGVPAWSNFQQVPSPFNFAECARFIVPEDAVDASQPTLHTSRMIEQLPKLINEKLGTLILFSSRKQMNEVMEGIDTKIKDICLIQGQASRHRLIMKHRDRIDNGEQSCLVGLASFAEGVDLPGDYLKTVIIAKLPFATPDNPIDAALAEWIEKQGGNPFMQITLPDACIKLVQSCGRLIRKESDSGEIFLLDNRVKTKRYGQQLISSLPPFKLEL